ncbi:MAG TPA: DUF6391 domain-containing protein [Dehalococcoidia bacterium]|nr:DUF6391 domain-containing protein [Dehalococcoidia bacterium]
MLKRVVNAVRRNHALEHATISILLSRHGPNIRVLGRAAPDGFYIYGDIPTETLRELAHEGLVRLQRGESHLAVSPLCGTNLAVAGVLAGFASLFAMGGRSRLDGIPGVIMAAMLAVLAAQPLGRLIQKHLTTSPELEGLRIVSVEPMGRRFPNLHKVSTAPVRG